MKSRSQPIEPPAIEQAEVKLRRALLLMSDGRPHLASEEELMLLATEVVSASELLDQARAENISEHLGALRTQVAVELREYTDDFRDPRFLRATRAARRHRPDLFLPLR